MFCGLWNEDHASYIREATVIEIGVYRGKKIPKLEGREGEGLLYGSDSVAGYDSWG